MGNNNFHFSFNNHVTFTFLYPLLSLYKVNTTKNPKKKEEYLKDEEASKTILRDVKKVKRVVNDGEVVVDIGEAVI